jgi:hypothetical protein
VREAEEEDEEAVAAPTDHHQMTEPRQPLLPFIGNGRKGGGRWRERDIKNTIFRIEHETGNTRCFSQIIQQKKGKVLTKSQ